MPRWFKTIKLKHLFTDDESYEGVQKIGNQVADVLSNHHEFVGIADKFRNLPKDNDWCSHVEAFNKILNEVYNIADRERIWID